MSVLLRVIINAVALWVAQALVPGISYQGDGNALLTWFILALVFGLINAFVRPIVILLTCPLQILTLGLFTLVVNALMLLLTNWLAGVLGIPFHVDGFWAAFFGGIVIGLVNLVLSIFFKDDK